MKYNNLKKNLLLFYNSGVTVQLCAGISFIFTEKNRGIHIPRFILTLFLFYVIAIECLIIIHSSAVIIHEQRTRVYGDACIRLNNKLA